MNANFKLDGLELESERLILRPFRTSDLQDFYDYCKVSGVGEMAGWKHHESMEKSKEIINLFIREDKTFAIVLKENGKVIGSLGVEKYGREEDLTEFNGFLGRELGYVLSKDYWGRGLMPEAVSCIIKYLFDDRNLDFLICGYFAYNTQSKKVQEKCGFKPYRQIIFETREGIKEKGFLTLLKNQGKNIHFEFSHPETLIYEGN